MSWRVALLTVIAVVLPIVALFLIGAQVIVGVAVGYVSAAAAVAVFEIQENTKP